MAALLSVRKTYWAWRCLVVSQAAQVIVHRVGVNVPGRQIGAGHD
jgi:hypothetical protein